MNEQSLASRSFTQADQGEFALLSGDHNPLHLDAGFARRTQMGEVVVHGVHYLLWALETVLRSAPFEVRSIKVRFSQPLFLHEIAQVRITTRTEAAVNVEVTAADTVLATVKLSSQPGKIAGSSARALPLSAQSIASPLDLGFERLAGRHGAHAAAASDGEIRRLFPALANAIGPAAVGALMAASQIVGMACPGLHSLFVGIDVTRDAASDAERALRYAVSKTDPRFRSLQIDVSGAGLTGRLEAFARLPPPEQPDMKIVAARVAKDVFAGQKALIIGGSRGLGEVAAKMIAAGGGHPVITYRAGKSEVEKIAEDIRQNGQACDIIQYDALQAAGVQLDNIGSIDSCYYFATAKIFQRKAAPYEPEKLRIFLSYYVDGFCDLCTTLAPHRAGRMAIFFPSTTAVEGAVAGLTEYAMAKAAGETLVNYLNAFLPNVHIVSRRLPRIMTDQTATVGVASALDALDVLLPIVYEVQQLARS